MAVTISEFINKIGFKVKSEDVQKVNDTIAGIKNTATKLLGAIGVGLSLASINELVEEFTAVNNGIRSAVDGLEDMGDAQKKILSGANEARVSYGAMATTVSNLVKSSPGMFPVDDAVEFTSTVTKLLKTAGRSESTIASVTEALNKSFQKGVVEAETLNVLLEQSPEAASVLANRLGVARTQLLTMATDGRISVNDLKEAFLSSADEIDAAFQNVDMNVSDALLNIRNRWGLWLAETDKMFGVTKTISKAMVSGFTMVINLLNKARTAVVWLSEKIGGMENLLKLVAITTGAFFFALNGSKILSFLKSAGSLLSAGRLKVLAIVAGIVLLALLVEDFFNFMQGNNSLIGELLTKAGVDVDAFRETVKGLWGQVKELLPIIKQFAQGIGKQLLSAVKQILPSLIELGKKALPVIVEVVKQIIKFVGQLAQAILPIVLSLIEQLLPFLVQVIESILPLIVTLLKAILPLLMEIISAILPAIIDLVNAILPLVLQLVEQVLPIILELIQMIIPILIQIVEAIMPVLVELVGAILPLLEPIFDIVAQLAQAILPLVVSLLNAILPILEPILGILKPIADILGGIIGAITKVVGWVADGLGWVVDLIFGTGDEGSSNAEKVNAYAKGTESTSDTFIAGEEGPELITGQPGKKVFTALETGNIFKAIAMFGRGSSMALKSVDTTGVNEVISLLKSGVSSAFSFIGGNGILDALSMLSRSATASPSTVTNSNSTRTVNQYNEFTNTFHGEAAVQKSASKAINGAANDATSELARGLAFAR